MSPTPEPVQVDVLVVGGGPAGLSAALVLARSRRSVLVVDDGEPRNAPAEGVHAFLTRDGIPPSELREIGRTEVLHYGAQVHDGRVVEATRVADRFRAVLGDGTVVLARRLVVTTGLVDELPDVPGVAERWGHDVVHCPYCHGWEVRDRHIGVLASGPLSLHQASLFRQLSDRVVVLRHTSGALDEDAVAGLTARGVTFVEGEVFELEVDDDAITGVRLEDGSRVPLDVLVVAPRFVGRTSVLESLGVETVEAPMGVGVHVGTDETGRTSVAGVWAAGNVTDVSAQVVTSAAQGTRVGAVVNADLVAEDTALARKGA